MARFDSIVAGRPIPDMLWFREGVRVHDDRLHKIVINEEGINSLIIDATSPSDAGQYTCIARNRAGEDTFTVHLNVLREFNFGFCYFLFLVSLVMLREKRESSTAGSLLRESYN